jgi:hypothetical protein
VSSEKSDEPRLYLKVGSCWEHISAKHNFCWATVSQRSIASLSVTLVKHMDGREPLPNSDMCTDVLSVTTYPSLLAQDMDQFDSGGICKAGFLLTTGCFAHTLDYSKTKHCLR